MILADLGTDVIKVEPVTGDGTRMAGKPFFGCQRGTRDIALNIKDPERLEIALELVRRADAAPQHDPGRGDPPRPRLLGVQGGDARHLNSITIRAENATVLAGQSGGPYAPVASALQRVGSDENHVMEARPRSVARRPTTPLLPNKAHFLYKRPKRNTVSESQSRVDLQ